MSTGSHPLLAFGSAQVDSQTAMKRKILRKAFNPATIKINNVNIKSTVGPFRSAMNLGDFLSRKYQTCGGCNQVNDVNSRILRPKMGGGLLNNSCDVTTNGVTPQQIPLKSGNTKYVADSSLYTRFRHLEGINKNYYDKTYGGNNSNGSYSFLNAIR